MTVIHTKGLTKRYRRFEKEPGLRGSIKSLVRRQYTEKTAVAGLDLEVEAGEFVGLIGPNGAGKTTTVKMLTGIIAPTEGELSVLGYYPNRLENAFKRQYAVVMGQKSQLFFELTAMDTFQLFRELYDVPEAEFRRSLDYLVELFGVEEHLNVQVRTLSLGERMKLELIVSLLHSPRVLFLDEPTIGLDAVAQKQIRGFLRQVNEERGTTILLTSHYMEDIRSLCRRCVVIGQGTKLFDGATDALFARYQTHKRITLQFAQRTDPVLPESCVSLEQSPYKVSFLLPRDEAKAALETMMARYDLSDVSLEEDDIGNVVERIYRGRAKA